MAQTISRTARVALAAGLACAGILAAHSAPPRPAEAQAPANASLPAGDLTALPPVASHAPGRMVISRYGPLNAHHPHYGLGLLVHRTSTSWVASVAAPATPATAGVAAGTVPAGVDLSADAPPVGNQGSANACVPWVVDYGLRGWYAKRDGYYPGGGAGNTGSFEPMYTYAQIVKGQNAGTSFDANLNIQQSQGVDTRADYAQGDYDYTTQPTAGETANAAGYKIASWANLALGNSAQQSIENALAGGNPVGLGLPVYTNFYNAGSTSYYVDVPTAGMTNYGNHAVFAIKYDANGVWVQNSWGTGWGLNGYVELSWSFVSQYVWQAVTIAPINPAPAATATSIPTATNSPAPSATATSTAAPSATATNISVAPATATNTAAPSATKTPVPAATATNTAIPTATATRIPAPSATATNTALPTATTTQPPTAIATRTAVPSATATSVPVATATSAPVATATAAPPTATITSIPAPAATATTTAVATATNTAVPTQSSTGTPVPSPKASPTPTPRHHRRFGVGMAMLARPPAMSWLIGWHATGSKRRK